MTARGVGSAVGAVFVVAFAASGCFKARADDSADRPRAGRPAAAVDVARVTVSAVADGIDVVGSLAPKFQAEIKSEYSGIVAEVYVTEWVRVRRGTPLARLDSREVKTALEAARAALLQAEVSETRAIRELDRAANLKEFGLVTAQQLDDARSAREAAAATTSAARTQIRAVETRLEKTLVSSPIDGVVAFRGVNVGDRVENMGGNSPMFRIVDPRVLDLTVQLPSSSLASVKVGQPLAFRVDALPGRAFDGRVMFINPTVDPVTRAALIVAEVPNPSNELKGGLFVKGRIVTGRREGVVQVPRTALLNWDLEKHAAEVFVVTGELAERRHVSTGRENGDQVEIAEGLAPGEQVVSRGAFYLRDGDRVKVVGRLGA